MLPEGALSPINSRMDGPHGGIKDRFPRLGKNDRDGMRDLLAEDNTLRMYEGAGRAVVRGRCDSGHATGRTCMSTQGLQNPIGFVAMEGASEKPPPWPIIFEGPILVHVSHAALLKKLTKVDES